jgi:hypothetical protein
MNCHQVVRVLELGLHKNKKTLQEGLIKAASEIGPYVDVILLGYGLCGNALQKPGELLVEAGVVMSRQTMEQNMNEFNQILDLRVESRAGSLKLLQDAWQTAKEMADVR